MSRYFDPDGKPITLQEWADLFERRTVGDDDSWWRKQTRVGDTDVSTVWLGLDYSFGGDTPLFWETMTFPDIKQGSYIEGILRSAFIPRGGAGRPRSRRTGATGRS